MGEYKKSDISVQLIDHSGSDLSIVNTARVSLTKQVNGLLDTLVKIMVLERN